MTQVKRWWLALAIVLGALALAAGCARFMGEVDFSADSTAGKTPLTVVFTPVLCGDIKAFVWNFGDGTTSTERSPEHTYAAAGSYTVTLLVAPRRGEPVAAMKADYIKVSAGMQGGRITPIYWTENGKTYVQRCLRDGGLVQGLDMWIDGPGDVTVSGAMVYWVDTVRGQIVKYDLTNSQNTVLATGRNGPYGVAVNAQAGRLYWTEVYANPAGTDGMVMQIALDGTGMGSLRQTVGRAYDIAYDSAHNKLYWSQHFSVLPRDWGQGSYGISVKDLASGTSTTVLSGREYPAFGIAVDSVNGRIYWTEDDAVRRCNLDGTDVQTIVTGADAPRGIAVDSELGKIYWGENGKIRSANLDGSGAQTVLTGLGQVVGLALG